MKGVFSFQLKIISSLYCPLLRFCLHITNRPSDRVREKKKIVRVLGGKLCGKNWRLCGNCTGLRNLVNKQIFDHRAQNKTRHGGISG